MWDKHLLLSLPAAHLLGQSRLMLAHQLHWNYTPLQQLKLIYIKAAFHTTEELPEDSWSQELQCFSSAYLIVMLNTSLPLLQGPAALLTLQ